MKTLNAGLSAHLSGSTTTLARCYIVRRKDGVTLGFTDHDRPLVIEGVVCEPESGFASSEAVTEAGFAVGGLEVAGALSSESLKETDLAVGRFDDAVIDIYLVNWSSLSEVLHERRARMGDITRRDGVFRAELRSLMADYDVPRGRYIRSTCDARFGDARCGRPLAWHRYTGTVLEGSDTRSIRIILFAVPSARFLQGELTFKSGALQGTVGAIRDQDGGLPFLVFTLADPLPLAPIAGTSIEVTEGCDNQYHTCRDRFANQMNFRGFPHIPGNDFIYSHPSRRGGSNTGGAR